MIARTRSILPVLCTLVVFITLSQGALIDIIQGQIHKTSTELDCSSRENMVGNSECVEKYLIKTGFQKESPKFNRLSKLTEEGTYSQALKDFQQFYSLEITGTLTGETLDLMSKGRCGVPDITPDGLRMSKTRRKKRYALHGTKWRLPNLTYCIKDYTSDLTYMAQEMAIRRSFMNWESQSGLTFTKADDCRYAVIEIRFVSGKHGDGEPFDGPGSTLAHAFFPKYGGDAHFDDEENWSDTLQESRSGKKWLIPIATHELGHSLGLGHSKDRDSIMYAYYKSSMPASGLTEDDIDGIQFLYGTPNGAPPIPATPAPTPAPVFRPPTPSPRPQYPAPPSWPTFNTNYICSSVQKPDAMVMLGDGLTYGFTGAYYWRMNSSAAIDTIPKRISETWRTPDGRGLSGQFDAVVFWPHSPQNCKPTCTGKTFFFRGPYVYVMNDGYGTEGQVNFPEAVGEVFPGLPASVDAATVWTGNNKLYFFKGGEYYKSSYRTKPYYIDVGYPKSLSIWDIGWNSVDSAAFYWQFKRSEDKIVKRTYFFKNNEYIRYNDGQLTRDPNYPKYTSTNWYGCSSRFAHLTERDEEIHSDAREDTEEDNPVNIEVIDNVQGMPMNDGIDRPNPEEKILIAGKDYINVRKRLGYPSGTDNDNYSPNNEILARAELLASASVNVKINVYKLVIFSVSVIMYVI